MTKILGWTDEVTVCDCCGKCDLSGTFACELEGGEEVNYGSVCVKRNTGIKNPAKAAADYKSDRRAAASVAFRQTAEFRALEARFAARPRDLIGRAAADFVREASAAAQVIKAEIAGRFNLQAFEVQ